MSGRYYHLCPEGEEQGRPCSLRHENEPERVRARYCCGPDCCKRDIEEAEDRCEDLARRKDRHEHRHDWRKGDAQLLRDMREDLAQAEDERDDIIERHEVCAAEYARRTEETDRLNNPVYVPT